VTAFKGIYNSLREIINRKKVKGGDFIYSADAFRVKILNISIESCIGLILFAKYNYSFYIIKLNKRVYTAINII